MKKIYAFLVTGAIGALLVSCETGSQSGTASKGAALGKKVVSNLPSVVSSSSADNRGLEKVARYKAQAEALAKGAPNSAQSSYANLSATIDAWVFAKTADAERLADARFGQVDLSAESTTDVAADFNTFKNMVEAGGTHTESATAAILLSAVAESVAKAAKQSRTASAESLKKTLARLKLASWSSVH
jgi:hypothetical protein